MNNGKLIIKEYLISINQEKYEGDFFKLFGNGKVTKEEALFIIDQYSCTILAAQLRFNADDLYNDMGINKRTVQLILEYFSNGLGSLVEYNQDYLFLENPIWYKPIIKIEETFFCPMPQVFFSFIIPTLNNIVDKYAKNELSLHRAKYLELSIDRIVKTRFPEAKTISNLKWFYEGKDYETDIITCIDSYILIIEAKSQQITKPALRGAPKRIKHHLDELFSFNQMGIFAG